MEAGAESFISWYGKVTARHTDAATQRLLQYLTDGFTAEAAVARTAAEVGPDSVTGAGLGVLTTSH